MAQNVLPGTILDITAIRLIETDEGPQATPPLMERAGLAAASQALSMIKDRSKPVLVLAGPGNNGGDGFVVARELEKQGWEVYVVFSSSLDKLPSDAASAYQRFIEAGGTTESEIPDKPWGLIVDALFGIGGARPIRGAYSVLVQTINKLDVPVLSLGPRGGYRNHSRLRGQGNPDSVFYSAQTRHSYPRRSRLLRQGGGPRPWS